MQAAISMPISVARCRQIVKQRARISYVGCIEPFGQPRVNLRQRASGVLSQQIGECVVKNVMQPVVTGSR
jgi:hypothetical protein